jgi:hypothetical protein
LRLAETIPHDAGREDLRFLLQGEAGSVVAGSFGRPDAGRFEQGEEERTQHTPHSDDPRGDSIDARVEVVQPEVHTVETIVGDDFAGDRLEIVG